MEKGSRLNRELWGSVVLITAGFAVLALSSYNPLDRSFNVPSGSPDPVNLGGLVGAYLADALLQGLGLTAWLLPVILLLAAFRLFRRDPGRLRVLRVLGYGALVWGLAILASLVRETESARDSGGGVLGGFSREFLTDLFGYAGTCVITVFLLLMAAMLLSQTSMLSWGSRLAGAHRQLRSRLDAGVARLEAGLAWLGGIRGVRKTPVRKKPAPIDREKEFTAPAIVMENKVSKPPPRRVRKKAKAQDKLKTEQLVLPEINDGYTLPSVTFLDPPPEKQANIDKASLEANSLMLQRKLQDFGIEGEVLAVRPGPVITVYEFRPAPGVMVRRIVGVADDLAMALSAVSIRILAPIPGEAVVGIEVPNTRRETVHLREVLEDPVYIDSGTNLPLALGKDISGAPFAADLASMPHLLVAGATGTGKSVALNSMILSILYRSTPEDVRFIMIDPKMLELTPYEGLPHLLTPVVTDPKEARAALYWAVEEMDRRYRLMRDKGARNIDNYNRILEQEPPPDKAARTVPGEDGASPEEPEVGGRLDGSEELEHGRLPRVVVLIDELADLMMSVGRDIEEHITRLAQKARAAGIHMVLATQRPSVDVITGLIKANFPARISFQVTSRVDSRTILDGMGAEHLLGNGDLLFLPPGTARLIRLHGPFVSDKEVRRVTDFIKQQGQPDYRPGILEAGGAENGDFDGADDDYDERYDQAVAVVTETRQASISMLQRRLRVGYNRAARMIEKMEREGVVGPADGVKPREVLARAVDPDLEARGADRGGSA